MTEYAERDIKNQGVHYTVHLEAMTNEGLNSKSDIAAELAHRDEKIDILNTYNAELREALEKIKSMGCGEHDFSPTHINAASHVATQALQETE